MNVQRSERSSKAEQRLDARNSQETREFWWWERCKGGKEVKRKTGRLIEKKRRLGSSLLEYVYGISEKKGEAGKFIARYVSISLCVRSFDVHL